MTASQIVAIVAVLLGAVLLGSLAALLGFAVGVGAGYLLWGREER